jgi:hypothetical protein
MWIHLMKNKKIVDLPGARPNQRTTPGQPLPRRITTAGRGILTQIKNAAPQYF